MRSSSPELSTSRGRERCGKVLHAARGSLSAGLRRSSFSTGVETCVEEEEIPANRRFFGRLAAASGRLRPPVRTLLCSPSPRPAERSLRRVEHNIEPTAERLWDDVSGRLREALNETTYATWFGDASAGDLDRRHVLARRPERLHARVDRGALPRLREGGSARCARARHPGDADRARARRRPGDAAAGEPLGAGDPFAMRRPRARSTRSTSS